MLDIDLNDPRVRDLLGEEQARHYGAAGAKRELVQLAGDDGLDIRTSGSMETGRTSTVRLSSGKHEVTVAYKDFVLTADVYAIPGEPLQVHLICPVCRHQLRVSEDRKKIDWDPQRSLLSIEPFKCTWEMPDAGDHVPGLISGGTSLCTWRVGIDKNVARDHR